MASMNSLKFYWMHQFPAINSLTVFSRISSASNGRIRAVRLVFRARPYAAELPLVWPQGSGDESARLALRPVRNPDARSVCRQFCPQTGIK